MAKPHPAIGGIRLVLGGNVFGWTIGRDKSFEVLDAFYEAGGRMIDTAEGYTSWIAGNKGGESETVLGEWMENRNVRSDMLVGTKTGMGGPPGALAPDKVAAAIDGSLDRLRTDYVDLYYAHRDEPLTPLDEVAGAFVETVTSGKARSLGASNYTAARLAELTDAAEAAGGPGFTVMQPEYNLVSRSQYEGALQNLCVARGIAVMPYFGLASGFLSGKYRDASDWTGSTRAYALDAAAAAGGWDVLAAVDEVARDTGAAHAEIALAWINAQPGIAAPLASATSVEQLADLVKAVSLELAPEHLAKLDAALPR